MTTCSRPSCFTTAALLGCVLLTGAASSVATSAGSSASRQVQEAAPPAYFGELRQSLIDRDYAAIDRTLEELPVETASNERVARFRATYTQHRANKSNALTERDEARSEAADEMREHLAAGSLTEALRAAVEVQELSGHFDATLDDEDIKRIVAWADEEIPGVEAERDWLAAQELLFFLRTLFEETSAHGRYAQYDEQLDAVNRRVALIARYAPHRLHELRVRRAEALGEDPPAPFNEAAAGDWRERLDDVDHLMLKTGLRIAAAEHIESLGWRPLLVGGLDALRLLATTPSLAETFENIGDAERVNRWLESISTEQRRLEALDDKLVTGRRCSDILDAMLWVNERTLELPPEVVYREFGDGATERLDKFSEIVWPDKLRRFEQSTQGNFVGVGILIRHNEKRDIQVVNPLEGTPAYMAGVKPDDIIVEVNGESTVGWSLNDAVDRITGKRFSTVTLGLQREDEDDLVDIGIVRDLIKIRSVKGWWKEGLDEHGDPEWDWYIDPISRIAYVKLTQFTEDSRADLVKAWKEISANGKPNGLILDLRYNPGGLLSSAVGISNLFLDQGVIVSGEDKDGEKAWPDQKADPRFALLDDANIPTVILINQGSASASEIVAGCLQAHGRATVIGKRSFGKGSVQTVHHIAPRARLKLTTQYYRLPAAPGERQGRLVHKRAGQEDWGVDPDIEVGMTPTQVLASLELRQEADIIPLDGAVEEDAERPEISDLLTEGLDPQLEVALLLLQAGALSALDGDIRRADATVDPNVG